MFFLIFLFFLIFVSPDLRVRVFACSRVSASRPSCTLSEAMAQATPSIDAVTAARLYAASGAQRWAVAPEAFRAVLADSVAHRFPEGAEQPAVDEYLASVHTADLGLALACRMGHEPAWEHFVLELRPALYATARTIAGDEGRELADSLYAELFGVSPTGAERRSLLAYYHGRSRLVTWMRAVLVQRLTDRRRATSRLVPLDAVAEATPAAVQDTDPDRSPYVAFAQQALDAAIDELDPRDRIRLRLYYGQDLTLLRIGRLLGESEATVSRRLQRARRQLRGSVERALRVQYGLSEEAVRRSFEYAAEAPELTLDRMLSRAEDG
jgi:RNA polymerase sigma-70 factor